MTVMEALSCGVPCVTTDVGDCARLIADCGCTVPGKDPEALAQAWAQWLRQPPATEMIRQSATARFDIVVAARGYEKVYQEVLS